MPLEMGKQESGQCQHPQRAVSSCGGGEGKGENVGEETVGKPRVSRETRLGCQWVSKKEMEVRKRNSQAF